MAKMLGVWRVWIRGLSEGGRGLKSLEVEEIEEETESMG